jgi:ParB/RepB/Spo0J family partition protein
MQVPLSLIKASPAPIRTTWDEEKMEELAQSIREQGVIVPVKVRPINGAGACPEHGVDWLDGSYEHYDSNTGYNRGCRACFNFVEGVEWSDPDEEEDGESHPVGPLFELVYGHRRVEAARRAGLEDIPAEVEEVEDDTALVQALIENVQREDMQPMDTARALKGLMQVKGWNTYDVERAGVMGHAICGQYLKLLDEPDEIQRLIVRGNSASMPQGTISSEHAAEIRRANLDPDHRIAVARKAADEGLGMRQTTQVAKSVAAAPTEEAKKRLLEWEYSPAIHDPELIKARAQQFGAHDPLYRDPTPTKQQQWDQTPEIKAAIDSLLYTLKLFDGVMKGIREMAGVGKLAPESRQYIAHRARRYAQTLTEWADELEEKDNGE